MAAPAGSTAATVAQTAAPSTAKAFFMVDPAFIGFFPGGAPPWPVLICRYNPKTLKISGGGTWEQPKANQKHELPAALFIKPNPRTMSLQLLFDQFELPSGDVSLEMKPLFDWIEPRLSPTKQASAPWLRFQWGAKRYFRCYIDSLSITYTMFSRSGAPLRATVDLSLKETFDPFPGTNPTSGGEGGERRHRVDAGDSLHSIAARHYGNPKHWRGLAAFNGVDDPFRLPTGVMLAIPDLAEIEDLS